MVLLWAAKIERLSCSVHGTLSLGEVPRKFENGFPPCLSIAVAGRLNTDERRVLGPQNNFIRKAPAFWDSDHGRGWTGLTWAGLSEANAIYPSYTSRKSPSVFVSPSRTLPGRLN